MLPHNLDAEASILGGVILRNEVLAQIPTLEVDDFYDMRHKVVFAAIRALEVAGQPIDVVTIETEVERQGKLDAIGGIAFLGDLAMRVPTADNVVAYAQIVHDKRLYRELALAADELLGRAYAEDGEPSDLLATARGDIERLARGYSDARQHIPLLGVHDAIAELRQVAAAPVYPTPWPTLNGAIGFGGFRGGQVYTVAAGTGRGKTSWVAELAAHTGDAGVPALIALYELGAGYFVARRAAGVIGTHSNEILSGRISYAAVEAAVPDGMLWWLHKRPLSEVRIAIDRLAQKFGRAPLVIVDYLQKLAEAIAATQERPDLRLATTAASGQLLEIAEQCRCAIVAVSAIGRGKGRVLATPRKFEPYELVEVAKESGAVEYDGGGLIVLTLAKDHDGEGRIATMTLAKARFGEELHVDARYNGSRGTWRDCGRVIEPIEVTTPAAAEPTNDELRARIIAELHKRPAPNRNAICDRVKGKRAVVLEVVRELFAGEVIANVGGGITLSELGRQQVIEGTS